MWSPDGKSGNESAKVRWEIVQYTRGTGLDLGAGESKAFAHFISVDNGHHEKFGYTIKPDVLVKDCTALPLFATDSMDFVYSSHLLEHIEAYKAALKEWWRVVKPGGYLLLYLPHADHYPNIHGDGEFTRALERKAEKLGRVPTMIEGHELCEVVAANRKARGIIGMGRIYAGSPHANSDHKHDFLPSDIIEAMRECDGWDLIENQERTGEDEYSFLQVYRKLSEPHATGQAGQRESWKLPKPKKTACVCRYGAFGDVIQASSVCAELKRQGYHVTFMGSPPGVDVLACDPNIDRFYLQDRDQVPNVELGSYWGYWQKRFDKWIQLSGSVEDTLLATPGRPSHAWPHAVRHKYLNRNYVEFSHELAELPYVPRQRFYPSPKEAAWAKEQRGEWGDFCVLWSLAGSSLHKTWDGLDSIIARIMLTYPKAHVILAGGQECKILETGWEHEWRVHGICGSWTIRQTMAMLDHVDLVIGPETGVLNAASMLPVPKVVFLSHSSVENLTRDWINCTSLFSKNTPCYPCHQLHLNTDGWDKFCPRTPRVLENGEVRGVAHCQGEISPEEVWDTVRAIMDAHYAKSEAA